jgi:hypothetical protein
MAAVLGLRGTGSFDSDARPKNYREGILLLFPNASAPLTALMSKLGEESVDDPEFKWFEKGLPAQTLTMAGAQATTSDTVLLLTAAAGMNKRVKPGHVLLNLATGEIVWVIDSSTTDQVVVDRAQGSVVATAIGASDTWLVIGSANQEGAAVGESVTYDPTTVSNFTQIFRSVLNITNTAIATKIRYADGQYLKEARREVLELHSIEMERAFLFGNKNEDTSGEQPVRTTGGLAYFVTTNVIDFGGVVSIDDWEDFLEDVFEDGSSEKLALVGNRSLNTLNKIARNNYTVTATPEATTYGMKMTQWITPFGTLQIKQHPLLSKDGFEDWGFIIDTAKLKYRYLRGRDTTYRENVQNPGDDATKNEFLTECGLEINHQTAHGIFKNATAFAA